MGSPFEVEVKLTSAKDLKNVNWRHGPIKPYAVIWVDPARKVTSRVDDDGDTSPKWKQTLVIPMDRAIDDATLFIDVVHAYAAEGTKPLIGSATVPLRDIGIGSHTTKDLKLKRPSGRPQGKMEVEVSVKDMRYPVSDPYYAAPYGVRDPYGAPPPASFGAPGAAYGVAPTAYAYGAPQVAYGAPPNGYPYPGGQAAGYPYAGGQIAYGQPAYGQLSYAQPVGYAQPVEEKKGKFGGMGMGTGIAIGAVAGALGGLALAEGIESFEDHVADDAAEKVEEDYCGYD